MAPNAGDRRFFPSLGISQYIRKLVKVKERLGPEKLQAMLYPVARGLLAESQRRAPVDTGALGASGRLVATPGKAEITLGFTGPYASFQDGRAALDRGLTEYLIRPKRKKKLFLPLTRKAKRIHRYCHNPAGEGLEYGVDYVLVKQVRVRIKSFGSRLGPNQYFSHPFRNSGPDVMRTTGQAVAAVFREANKGR